MQQVRPERRRNRAERLNGPSHRRLASLIGRISRTEGAGLGKEYFRLGPGTCKEEGA